MEASFLSLVEHPSDILQAATLTPVSSRVRGSLGTPEHLSASTGAHIADLSDCHNLYIFLPVCLNGVEIRQESQKFLGGEIQIHAQIKQFN